MAFQYTFKIQCYSLSQLLGRVVLSIHYRVRVNWSKPRSYCRVFDLDLIISIEEECVVFHANNFSVSLPSIESILFVNHMEFWCKGLPHY